MKVTHLECRQADYPVLAIVCTWKSEPKGAKVQASVQDSQGVLLGQQKGDTAGMAVFAESTFKVGQIYLIEVGTSTCSFKLKDNGKFQAICVNSKPYKHFIVLDA